MFSCDVLSPIYFMSIVVAQGSLVSSRPFSLVASSISFTTTILNQIKCHRVHKINNVSEFWV
jgi:hypothetical protein